MEAEAFVRDKIGVMGPFEPFLERKNVRMRRQRLPQLQRTCFDKDGNLLVPPRELLAVDNLDAVGRVGPQVDALVNVNKLFGL